MLAPRTGETTITPQDKTKSNTTKNKHASLTKNTQHKINTTTTPQPFYGPFSETTRVSQCQKRTSGLYDARDD